MVWIVLPRPISSASSAPRHNSPTTLRLQKLDDRARTRSQLAVLTRRELYDLPDPRRSVLDDAVRRGRAVLVEVHNA